ncbi:MAG: adenylosuccinate synthetase [Candidatus Kariarchaeaceae archaeon]|jgi:adenylosuccinate synthase
MAKKSNLSIVVGGQYGDEGKGKITSYLAASTKYDAIVRAGTGPNAGHTVVHEGKTYKLRLIPSGFFSEGADIFIGAGVLISEDIFFKEIADTNVVERVFIDYNTGVITHKHIKREKASTHLMATVGSTGSGCGPANEDRIRRTLKLAQDYPELEPYLTDVSERINDILDNGGKVLVEGSQATFLSIYHGNYPFVTSKDVTASACLSDIGVGPTRCNEVIVVLKAFVTRVGNGELQGELPPDEVKKRGWQEFGTVTRRLRRAAPFDFDLAKRAIRINGATCIALTKMDVLFPELKSATKESQLNQNALEFILELEDITKVPVKYVSTGPSSTELIVRNV